MTRADAAFNALFFAGCARPRYWRRKPRPVTRPGRSRR